MGRHTRQSANHSAQSLGCRSAMAAAPAPQAWPLPAWVPLLTGFVALAGCEAATGGSSRTTGGTVIETAETKMRITKGEVVDGMAGGALQLLHITRADGRGTTPKDERAARAAYTAYCADKGGPGAEGEAYYSRLGAAPAWEFGDCGA